MNDATDTGGVPGRAHGIAQRLLGLACAGILISMMFLTGADVIARYILNAPIRGAFELTEVMMVLLVYMALPLAVLAKAHVEVELWQPKSPLLNLFRLILVAMCTIAVFTMFSIELWDHGMKFWSRESVTNSLGLPLSYVAFAASGGAALCMLFVVTGLWERLTHR